MNEGIWSPLHNNSLNLAKHFYEAYNQLIVSDSRACYCIQRLAFHELHFNIRTSCSTFFLIIKLDMC